MVTVDNNETIQKVTTTGNISKRYQIQKLQVYNEILQRLKEAGNEEAIEPGFDDDLLAHFNRLPNRYAHDVNAESAEDVLMHKRLLSLAYDPANGIAFDVRIVQ
nr:serine/threonine-protein kinase STY46-like isoform X1 [Tanacetum cinerariifolium]